ncbi:hypothetical protein ACFL9T_04290 [Thermodesulfobacteriota bacterium]
MVKNNPIYMFVSCLASLLLLSGCLETKNYAKIRLANGPKHKMTIEELIDNWTKYDIFFSGTKGEPTAILFDPKAADKKLIHRNWSKIENQKDLQKRVAWIRMDPNHGWTYAILGLDNRFFGYMFTARYNDAVIHLVDENTLEVYSIQQRRGVWF